MKTKVTILSAVAALSLGLAGCDQYDLSTGQTVGGLGGAVAGGVLGSQFGSGSGRLIATGVGAVVGGLLGSELGRRLEPQQQQQHNQAAYQAFETAPAGQSVSWGQQNTGTYGSVTPTTGTYQSGGQTCRDYTQTIHVDGQAQTARGVACRNADGTWRIVS